MQIDTLENKALKYIERKKYMKALKIFLKIEKMKKGAAAFNIGTVYADICDSKCKRYRQKEIKWYKIAIENGDCVANTNLAICYQSSRKIKKAKKYFKRAVKCGDLDASLDLALIYLSQFKIKKSKKYLELVLTGIPYDTVTEYSVKRAKKLLRRIKKQSEEVLSRSISPDMECNPQE